MTRGPQRKTTKKTTDPSSTADLLDQFLVGIVRGAISKIFGSDYVVENLRFEDRKIKLKLKRLETT
jgi:hypothetical protein